MSYIGAKPFDQTAKTSTIATGTGSQTTFYPDGGYLVGFVDVYYNGVKLAPFVDYTATDGVGVTLTTAPVNGSSVEIVAYWATSLTDAVTTTAPAGGTVVVRDVIPAANNTYNLGNTTNRFANAYLSANGVMIGNAVVSSNSTSLNFSYPNGTPIAISANLSVSLPDTGVVANAYGNSSQIPVITVDSKGRITNASTTAVAGVTGFTYTGANNTFSITTGDGSTFSANISANSIAALAIGATGVVANAYGNSTAIPVLTIDEDGRISNATTTSISGITNVVWTSANNTLTVNTSTTAYQANLSQFDQVTTFNANVTLGGTTTTKALIPDANVTYDLGSTTKRYKDLYLANSTIYIGNSSVSEVSGSLRITNEVGGSQTLATNNDVATAYSNAASYADTKAATAYSNATSYADTKAATAYSNATTYAATIAGTAYANAASYADTKAATAYSNATAFAANATNITSGTLTGDRIQANSGIVGNTSGVFVKAGTGVTVNATGVHIGQNVANTANVSFNNITITGNLTVQGTTTTVNTQTLSVQDNMIYLNANSVVSNPDLGFAGNYNDGTYAHAGVFRDATDGVWKFFHQYAPEPDASPYIDTANNTFALANVQANTFIGNLTGSANSATYLGGNTASDLRTYSATIAGTAYTNATSYADTKAATAYTNATSYSSNATNISSGTVAFARLPSLYHGTTAVQSTSTNQAMTGITSVAMPGSTSGTVTLQPTAVAGTTTITFPATTGTVITTGDSGTVTSTMIADGTIVNADISASAAIATSKISGLATSATTDTTNANNITSGTLAPARLPQANTTANGAVIFLDSVSNTSTSVYAPTMNAVKTAYDNAGTAYTNATSYAATIAGTAYSNAVAYAASNSYVNSTFLKLSGGTMTGSIANGTFSTPVTITGNGSYVGNYGYSTLILKDTSGYPGLNWRNANANWLFRMNAGGASMSLVYSSNASAQDTGSYTDYYSFDSGTFRASADVRAPIFYDYNDTSYYADPSGASILGSIYSRVGSQNWRVAYASYYGYSSSYGAVVFGATSGNLTPCFNVDPISNLSGSFSGTGNEVMFQNGVYFISPNSANNGYNQYFRMIDGYVQATNSSRAPIFYDSNNTSYYVDPASTSYINALTTVGQTRIGGEIYVSATNTNTLNSGFSNAADGSDIWINYRGYNDGQSYYRNFNIGDGRGTNIVWGDGPNKRFSINNGQAASYTLHVNGISYAATSSRAPIFYDSDDTNYWVDPAASQSANFAGHVWIGSASFANPGGWSKTLTLDGTNHARIRLKASAYGSYSANESYFWLDNTVTPNSGIVAPNIFYLNASYTQAAGSLRAPLFYDLDDTGYYLDPNSVSNLNSVTALRIGVNPGGSSTTQYGISLYSGYTSGEPTYGLLFTGTATPGGHGGVTGNWATYFTMNDDTTRGWIFRRVGSGNSASITAGGLATFDNSIRSPIFYDSNNTSYYVDPNSTGYSAYFAGAVQASKIGLEDGGIDCYMEITDSNPTYLGDGYGGEFYFYGDKSRPSALLYAGGIDVSRSLQAGSSLRAPIFYDSNDTTYYVDPNSSSQMYTLYLWNALYMKSAWMYFDDTDRNPGVAAYYPNSAARAVRWSFASASQTGTGGNYSGVLHFHPWDGTTSSTGDASYQLAFGSTATNGSGTPQLAIRKGIDTTWNSWYYIPMYGVNAYVGSLYPTIVYDGNDTGYFADPNSTSRMYQINFNYMYWAGDTNYGFISSNVYADTLNSGYSYDPLELCYVRGTWCGISHDSLRAPLFYDYDNTSYYVDPNSYSYVYSLRAASYLASSGNIYTDANYGYGLVGTYASTRYQGVFAMGDSYKLAADGTTTGTLYGLAWSHPNAGGVAANLNTHGLLAMENGTWLASLTGSTRARDDMRAPIFYDNNNTSYYVDPNSASQFSLIYANDWFRAQGGCGLYFQDYGRGLRAPDAEGSSYGNVSTYGAGRNGWRGYAISSRMVWMSDLLDGGSTTGMHDNNYGWVWRWINESYFTVDRGYSTFAGSARAPIFYDSDDTGYYTNQNSVSRYKSLNVGNTGTITDGTYAMGLYHNSRYLLALRYSSGEGYYPWLVNDYGNGVDALVIHFNAIGDKFYFNRAGVGYAASSWRSSLFYDIDDTSYYMDPAGSTSANFAGDINFRGELNWVNSGNHYFDINGDLYVRYSDNSSFWTERWRLYGSSNLIDTTCNQKNTQDNVAFIWGADGNIGFAKKAGYTGCIVTRSDMSIYFAKFNQSAGAINPTTVSTYTQTNIAEITPAGAMILASSLTQNGSPSDERLKENIQPITGALNKVLQLQGVTFDWKEGTKQRDFVGITHDIGVIAQQVQKVVPELVAPDKDEEQTLAVRDRGLIALLIESVKEQQSHIETQQHHIEAQQKTIDSMQAVIQELLNKLSD